MQILTDNIYMISYKKIVFLLLYLFSLKTFANNCAPENSEAFLKKCASFSKKQKRSVQKVPLWQGTDHEGYQLINCKDRTIKNVIQNTGASYSCNIAKDYVAKSITKENYKNLIKEKSLNVGLNGCEKVNDGSISCPDGTYIKVGNTLDDLRKIGKEIRKKIRRERKNRRIRSKVIQQ